MAIRRWFAFRKRLLVRESWPILPGSEHPPEGWRGWPKGKQFSLILTHDVESNVGLEHCRSLMRLETQLGFRSSFNFVPEGGYPVPRELREELQANGFEVGVQDLKHDGKLFRDRESFRKGARQINRYLKEWGAVGFRAGFMFHNLDWVHDLEIEYDSCTFDTDPFEPQPDGVGTIFPFWVPASERGRLDATNRMHSKHDPAPGSGPRTSKRSGYVELPYTLPQDSTVFTLFRERNIDIWKRKLDWIAANKGMALVNVHPDYLLFPGRSSRADGQYPVALYREFLEYLLEAYADRYWHVLPCEMARFVHGWQAPALSAGQEGCDATAHAIQKLACGQQDQISGRSGSGLRRQSKQ
jgi:hypothetical protein